MVKRIMFSLSIVLLMSVSMVSLTWADSIKERMKQRLPRIVQMKKQMIVGENDKGYLEYISENRPNRDLINAENEDRRKVYEMIANQQGVTLQKVEELRALQIVKKAAKGEMLKKSDGTWYRK